MTKTICIYHHNCTDGFGAAWVVHKALGETVEFHPGVYRESPPDVSGKNVVLVDFSYPREVIIEMAKVANSILIIDHHKTAIEDLVDLPSNVGTVFDQGFSGAVLTWRYLFPKEPAPALLNHIQDRDLWKFELDKTKAVLSGLRSYPFDFNVWSQFIDAGQRGIDQLIVEGESIERKYRIDLDGILASSVREMEILGHRVLIANAPGMFASDIGNRLTQGRPFGGSYYDTQEGRSFSLRSTDAGEDVSLIAKHFGGGGHRNAAGFRVSFEDAASFEIEQVPRCEAHGTPVVWRLLSRLKSERR